MKVKELQKLLDNYNPDAEITRDDSETICLSYIPKNRGGADTTELVFIEKCDYVDDRFDIEY
jgi:hypothetical protein